MQTPLHLLFIPITALTLITIMVIQITDRELCLVAVWVGDGEGMVGEGEGDLAGAPEADLAGAVLAEVPEVDLAVAVVDIAKNRRPSLLYKKVKNVH
jgi:hypothetical protein